MILKEMLLTAKDMEDLEALLKRTIIRFIRVKGDSEIDDYDVDQLSKALREQMQIKFNREYHEGDPVKVYTGAIKFVDATFIKYTEEGMCIVRYGNLNKLVNPIFLEHCNRI